METNIASLKLVVASVFTFIVTALGGADDILSLLVVLIISDLITGFTYACMQKNVSSTKLRDGLIRKGFVFLAIFVAYRIDICVAHDAMKLPQIFGHELSIRSLFIIYACLEEGISLLENLANLGVPMPKWVKSILVQVSDSVTNSTPKVVIEWIKKTFNINLSSGVAESDDIVETTNIDKVNDDIND